jgi:GNAT superfamily N-acetyltransferase
MTTLTMTGLTVRHELQPGDLGRVAWLHGRLYAEEYGFDHRFEAYVAATLGEFGQGYRPERDRLWLAEQAGVPVGSAGILGRDDGAAQLRWLIVAPQARGHGLGRQLVHSALAFCRVAGYRSVYLWTVDPLTVAARLYAEAGFRQTESLPPAAPWGVTVREERYDLTL